ncbi:DUF6798 domain-containing protein [Anatilimnocola floriformis]|uniref:DUF6798 domain-containing protein n=1 Tax=Anatilimnocola floriformis TaxID=2948575 RepID=UPI0020C1C4A4|nr:DUF6798 domain-containing protein [Anatilimnocola floriformis]
MKYSAAQSLTIPTSFPKTLLIPVISRPSPPLLEVIDSGAVRSYGWKLAAVETLFILLLFFLIAGSPPPGVGESHYLPKAKHYWDPAWCRGDLFLESADAHLTFYWCFGWVTKFCSLTATAWIGRGVTWLLLAWSWQRLSVALVPKPLFSILSGGLLLIFTRWFHLAGEWIIGGIEAKSFSYVFFFLSLECLVRRRWTPAWLLMGTAAAFHVLIGGWGCLLLGGVWLIELFLKPKAETPSLWRMAPAVIGGFILSLPGLLPAVLLNRGVESDVAREAATAYVFERLGHHLVFHRFDHFFMARHLVLLITWAVLAWQQRHDVRLRALHIFTLGAVLMGLCGAIIDQSLLYQRELAAKLLRYYWFRLSDTMLAASVAIALAQEISRRQQSRPAVFGVLVFLAIVAVGADVALTVQQRNEVRVPAAFLQPKPTQTPATKDEQAVAEMLLPELFERWQDVCLWIKYETPSDARFLTPRRQQTFKWYAQRPEVVNWKDVPQDAAGLAKWKAAMDEVYPRATFEDDLAAHIEPRLLAIAHKYNVKYIVLDRTRAKRGLNFPRVYPAVHAQNPAYEVYAVPPLPKVGP